MSDKRTIAGMDAMLAFGQEIGQGLRGGEVFFLQGVLGSGKTTFVQGVASVLGIAETVTSPTYTVVAEYGVSDHPSIETLVHVDLYRLDEHRVAEDASVQRVLERLGEAGVVTFIEWAEKLGEVGFNPTVIAFEQTEEEGERLVTISHGQKD